MEKGQLGFAYDVMRVFREPLSGGMPLFALNISLPNCFLLINAWLYA